MKNTRKILTFLLTLALFAMCFSFMAYAEEGVSAVDEQVEDNLAAYAEALALDSKVLEFYEAGTYFNLKVEDSEVSITESDECKLLKGAMYTQTVIDDALHIQSFNPTKINLNDDGSFGVNFSVKLTPDSPVTLYVMSSETGDYMSLFSISASEGSAPGKITHKFNPDTISYETEEVWAIYTQNYYDVAIYVENTDGTDNVTIKVSGEGKELFSTSYSYSNEKTDFLAGEFNFDSAYLSTKDATFAYVEAYPGSFQRYLDNSLNTKEIANGVVKAYEDYVAFKSLMGIDSEAFELAEMISKIAVLYDYNYTTLQSVDKAAVKAAFEDCVAIVSAAYEAEVYEANTVIETEGFVDRPYNDKLDTVNAIFNREAYMQALEVSEYAALSAVDFAKIKASVENANAELVKLNKIEADSIYIIEELSKISNIYLATYQELKTAYAAVLSTKICDTYYSELYSADVVNEAVQKRNKVMSDYPILNAQALSFVESMAVATDTTVQFSDRYAAYVTAKENIFTDVTYNLYLEDTTIEELLEMYDVLDAEMMAVSDYAEAFLSKIREAVLTPSYTVKTKALDDAKPYLADVEAGYPGVEDAIANYYAMREDISSRKESAKRYIQAVLNVQIASTVKEKLVAIEIAEGFAILGQELSVTVEGMPITVNEANIILTNEKSTVTLKQTRINNYVAAADAISSNQTLLERRKAINAAMALKVNLTEDLEEEDVIKATAAIDAAIAAYNADVNTANTVAEEKDTTALNLLAKTVPSKKIADVVAIIKKFYE